MNPAHEERTRDILSAALPGLEMTLSSEVSPEMREYERISTACANAYVQPLMSRHLRGLHRQLADAGVRCPLYLMLSGGGITTLETAVRFPVRLVESGPAGGAIFASHIARELGLYSVLSYDMGGTTAKICLIATAPRRRPAVSRWRGLPVPAGQRHSAAHTGHSDGRNRCRRGLHRHAGRAGAGRRGGPKAPVRSPVRPATTAAANNPR